MEAKKEVILFCTGDIFNIPVHKSDEESNREGKECGQLRAIEQKR